MLYHAIPTIPFPQIKGILGRKFYSEYRTYRTYRIYSNTRNTFIDDIYCFVTEPCKYLAINSFHKHLFPESHETYLFYTSF